MTTAGQHLAEDYAEALKASLRGSGELALQRAYELGRRAVVEGLSLLELVSLHHEALQRTLRDEPPGPPNPLLFEAAQTFLVESLSPFEMAQREFRGGITALRQFNQRLEDEARRIAQSLHDDAGQILVTVHLALNAVSQEHPLIRGRLLEVRALLDEVENHLRRLSHELRPAALDSLGLLPALEFLARGVTSRTGTPIAVDGPRDGRLPISVETAVYRIVQEALTNATRHGRARRVVVSISRGPGAVKCIVSDDGVGFEPAAALSGSGRGLGLIGMRERLNALGGHLTIDSGPGRGTELVIDIPLEMNHASAGASR